MYLKILKLNLFKYFSSAFNLYEIFYLLHITLFLFITLTKVIVPPWNNHFCYYKESLLTIKYKYFNKMVDFHFNRSI